MDGGGAGQHPGGVVHQGDNLVFQPVLAAVAVDLVVHVVGQVDRPAQPLLQQGFQGHLFQFGDVAVADHPVLGDAGGPRQNLADVGEPPAGGLRLGQDGVGVQGVKPPDLPVQQPAGGGEHLGGDGLDPLDQLKGQAEEALVVLVQPVGRRSAPHLVELLFLAQHLAGPLHLVEVGVAAGHAEAGPEGDLLLGAGFAPDEQAVNPPFVFPLDGGRILHKTSLLQFLFVLL